MPVAQNILAFTALFFLVTGLALAIALAVRACEAEKQMKAGVEIAEVAATTDDIQKGQLVSTSNGTLFPLTHLANQTVVHEPLCLLQRLYNQSLIEVVEARAFNPVKGETGYKVHVRRACKTHFLPPKNALIVPLVCHANDLEVFCTDEHVVVVGSGSLALFKCDWKTGELASSWHTSHEASHEASREAYKKVCTVSVAHDGESVKLILRNGAHLTLAKAGHLVVSRKPWLFGKDKCLQHIGDYSLCLRDGEFSVHSSDTSWTLPRGVKSASLSTTALFWSVEGSGEGGGEGGGVFHRSLQPLLSAECVAACSVDKVVASVRGSVAGVTLSLTGGGTALLTLSSNLEWTLTRLGVEAPAHSEACILNDAFLIAVNGEKGVALVGHQARWEVQPGTDFLGLVVKRNKKSAFVARKGPLALKGWMPPELSVDGWLAFDRARNVLSVKHTEPQKPLAVCARLADSKITL
jgi:hypothetical protein